MVFKGAMMMWNKRLLCLWMALALVITLPAGGLAAKKASIQLSGKLGLMFVGETVRLRPKLKRVSRSDVSFASSAPDVASVDAEGSIRALAEGRAVITVSGGGAKARCGVVVLSRAVTLSVGEKYALPNGTLEKYKVKDRKVATVSKKGVLTGKSEGSTVVAVKYGKQTLKVNVTVGGAEASEALPEETPATPAASQSKAAGLDAARQAEQIVLVEGTGSSATLSLHEKVRGVWTQRLETSAYVGKNGFGKTREGDKKTPTGTYNLNTPFGIKDDPGANMPYTKVTKYHYWCGSSDSEYYNQLVDSRVTGRSYTDSDEHLIDYKGAYNYCMFIDYNAAGEAGKGSCIFLHCKGKNRYTAGCIAVDESVMKQIIQWARPGVKIVIRET